MGKFTGVRCPKCGKKGLYHPNHAHAYGWKEFGEVNCRFCKARFITEKIELYIKQEKAAQNCD